MAEAGFGGGLDGELAEVDGGFGGAVEVAADGGDEVEAVGDAEEGDGGFEVVGGVEAFHCGEAEVAEFGDAGLEAGEVGLEAEGVGHDDNATGRADHLDAFGGGITEFVAVAEGVFAEVFGEGVAEV